MSWIRWPRFDEHSLVRNDNQEKQAVAAAGANTLVASDASNVQ